MAGKLPAVRPTSASYGRDMIDDRPVEDASRETSADNWNDLKADAAYAARMAPLLRIRVTNNGTAAAVAAVVGPENVTTGQVAVSRTAQGVVTVNISGTGLSGSAYFASGRHATQSRDAGIIGPTSTGCTVVCRSLTVSGGTVQLDDSDFDLLVY